MQITFYVSMEPRIGKSGKKNFERERKWGDDENDFGHHYFHFVYFECAYAEFETQLYNPSFE